MLSVFVPSFNHAAYVTEAIASARRIDVPGTHVYVIDDASTDGSATAIEDYLARTGAADITFIKKTRNRGVIDSMLTFMDRCRTEYVYVVSSDDLALADGVAELVRRLEAHPTMGFIIGGGSNLLPDGSLRPIYGKRHDALFSTPAEAFIEKLFLMDASPLLCQSSVFRLSALRATGAVSAEIVADDYAIFSKLFQTFRRRGEDFDFAPEVDVVHYRHHATNNYRQLIRQVDTSIQVLEAVAPAALRDRAIAYKLAFFFLVASRRRDVSSARAIAGRVGRRRVGAFAAGLAAHAYWWRHFR